MPVLRFVGAEWEYQEKIVLSIPGNRTFHQELGRIIEKLQIEKFDGLCLYRVEGRHPNVIRPTIPLNMKSSPDREKMRDGDIIWVKAATLAKQEADVAFQQALVDYRREHNFTGIQPDGSDVDACQRYLESHLNREVAMDCETFESKQRLLIDVAEFRAWRELTFEYIEVQQLKEDESVARNRIDAELSQQLNDGYQQWVVVPVFNKRRLELEASAEPTARAKCVAEMDDAFQSGIVTPYRQESDQLKQRQRQRELEQQADELRRLQLAAMQQQVAVGGGGGAGISAEQLKALEAVFVKSVADNQSAVVNLIEQVEMRLRQQLAAVQADVAQKRLEEQRAAEVVAAKRIELQEGKLAATEDTLEQAIIAHSMRASKTLGLIRQQQAVTNSVLESMAEDEAAQADIVPHAVNAPPRGLPAQSSSRSRDTLGAVTPSPAASPVSALSPKRQAQTQAVEALLKEQLQIRAQLRGLESRQGGSLQHTQEDGRTALLGGLFASMQAAQSVTADIGLRLEATRKIFWERIEIQLEEAKTLKAFLLASLEVQQQQLLQRASYLMTSASISADAPPPSVAGRSGSGVVASNGWQPAFSRSLPFHTDVVCIFAAACLKFGLMADAPDSRQVKIGVLTTTASPERLSARNDADDEYDDEVADRHRLPGLAALLGWGSLPGNFAIATPLPPPQPARRSDGPSSPPPQVGTWDADAIATRVVRYLTTLFDEGGSTSPWAMADAIMFHARGFPSPDPERLRALLRLCEQHAPHLCCTAPLLLDLYTGRDAELLASVASWGLPERMSLNQARYFQQIFSEQPLEVDIGLLLPEHSTAPRLPTSHFYYYHGTLAVSQWLRPLCMDPPESARSTSVGVERRQFGTIPLGRFFSAWAHGLGPAA